MLKFVCLLTYFLCLFGQEKTTGPLSFCVPYFMRQVMCVAQYMYPSVRAFDFSAFFTDKLYSIIHTEAKQNRWQKECISLRVRWSTEKCWLLDIAWLLHIWKYSNFCYCIRPTQEQAILNFSLGGGGSLQAPLLLKHCWQL